MFIQVHDPNRLKEETRRQWQEAAPVWRRWQPAIRQWMGAATDLMLDLAQIEPGDHILDIAAGDGDPSVEAARRTGPTGRVMAIDLAERMLTFAARSAQEAGIANLETRVMDAENLLFADQSFDAVICRLGLMFFLDIRASLNQMRRVLKPGGRACMMVFTQPERNDFFSIPLSIIRAHLGPASPLPGRPSLFRLGDRGVLEAYLVQAGFRQVETHIIAAPLRLVSAAECVRFERDLFAALHTLLAGVDDTAREETWREIEAAFTRLEDADGFTASCEVTVGVGAKAG